MDKKELQQTAVKVRKGIVTAVHAAKAGHPGGSLSAADIFTSSKETSIRLRRWISLFRNFWIRAMNS